ncbi:peptide deformylase [Patescibacteria group bacterium]|nr:peptide deformylase [Patescibacteria group bacterium]MBU1886006.1 peptide deformylase [Patescibacteria group bacterium]
MTKNLLQIALLGHPVLRKKAQRVKSIKERAVQSLIDDLIYTVMDANGVGIAAPQVYRSLQIFIMASHPNERYPNAPEMPATPVINPKITHYSEETELDWEGCLSMPGVRALVPRSKTIKVTFQDREGNKHCDEYEGFIARIFQHEYDHLNGLVFFDRLDSLKDIYMEKEYKKIISTHKLVRYDIIC